MEFATGALGTLLPKLANLLHGEYKLQKNVRKNIEYLTKELEHTQAALRSVGEVPLEELPELVKIWARDARELSYDMEDVVDTFLVRVQGPDPPSKRSSRKFIKQIKESLLAVGKRHQIGEQIKGIKERVVELAARRDRYNRYKDHTVNPVATKVDPRIKGIYAKATDLVGINKAKEELVMKLQQQRIVSIVGFGGLGKTTLARAVYDEIKSQFDSTAFVTVSQNPDMKKFLKKMLCELDHTVHEYVQNSSLDESQLIDIAQRFLHDKRCLIIIDDIWKTSDWDIIKLALPDDNIGSRIITTTRIVTVANFIGHAYEMQPLSPNNSRVLMYRRIFGTEDGSEKILDDELSEVSDRIIKKCGGVPLAVITIASLLANKGRNKSKWDEVYNSIGNGMENSPNTKDMRKILSYSYYDLPSYLRTCLLYLSTFPEDYEIEKDRLIWLWIAEGFIQHGKHWKKSLFELGESYFNELINRSMIQPIYFRYIDKMSCRVHDMVLDLIRSISSEENFVTILSNMDQNCPSSIARRLSLQNGNMDHAMTQTTQSMSLVRSVIVFPSALDQMPALRSFKMLRVLDLGGCDLSKDYSLQYLGSLFHLRYLSLRNTGIVQLPTAVGNLQFLKVLDVSDNLIDQLPECVAQLTHLLCLSVDLDTRVSNGIGSLSSLEELTILRIDDGSRDTIEGLGLLTELRVLSMWLCTNKWTDKLVESLCKLQKIQSLSMVISSCPDNEPNVGGLDGWVPSPQLRSLDIISVCWFLRLPVWINNHTQFQDLAYLRIGVNEPQQEDLEILGRLPALHILGLRVKQNYVKTVGGWFTGVGSFPCLERCFLYGFVGPVIFQQGAMPRLDRLEYEFILPEVSEVAGSDGGFELGLGNLQSLEDITVRVKGGASKEEVEEAKAAVRREVEIHPNRPRLDLLDEGEDIED